MCLTLCFQKDFRLIVIWSGTILRVEGLKVSQCVYVFLHFRFKILLLIWGQFWAVRIITVEERVLIYFPIHYDHMTVWFSLYNNEVIIIVMILLTVLYVHFIFQKLEHVDWVQLLKMFAHLVKWLFEGVHQLRCCLICHDQVSQTKICFFLFGCVKEHWDFVLIGDARHT